MDSEESTSNTGKSPSVLKTKAKEVVFLTGVAGMSIFFGFGLTLALAKKKDPTMFHKGLVGGRGEPDSGATLALRALAWGTAYSVTGVSLLSYGVWKLMGVNNMNEFRTKIQSIMPRPPPSENPGKSDFKTVRELVEYIQEKDKGR